ncbi:hypothetical protein NX059_006630 [Plenodomus lindquistii]|nr:hypothetical protein NX059_006630 [Plenodomus lindquistii]
MKLEMPRGLFHKAAEAVTISTASMKPTGSIEESNNNRIAKNNATKGTYTNERCIRYDEE